MKERRISHVPLGDLVHVAAARALACAGLAAEALDLVIVGSTLGDELAPNVASGVQARLGATNAAAMDLNTACTSFLYGLSAATALVRTGVLGTVLVAGAEAPSPFIDWGDRNTAVLFGDGCGAVVVQAAEREEGLLSEKLGCYADARDALDIRGVGARYANRGIPYGHTRWIFDGQEIFKRAVVGMALAGQQALAKRGMTVADVDLLIPHQANRRIIDAVGRRVGIDPSKVFVNVHRYANMSAATVPVALVEALEEGRVRARRAPAPAELRRRALLVRPPGALGRADHPARDERRGAATLREDWPRARPGAPRAKGPVRRARAGLRRGGEAALRRGRAVVAAGADPGYPRPATRSHSARDR